MDFKKMDLKKTIKLDTVIFLILILSTTIFLEACKEEDIKTHSAKLKANGSNHWNCG